MRNDINPTQRRLKKAVTDLREMLSDVPGLDLSPDEQARLADYLETVHDTIKGAVSVHEK